MENHVYLSIRWIWSRLGLQQMTRVRRTPSFWATGWAQCSMWTMPPSLCRGGSEPKMSQNENGGKKWSKYVHFNRSHDERPMLVSSKYNIGPSSLKRFNCTVYVCISYPKHLYSFIYTLLPSLAKIQISYLFILFFFTMYLYYHPQTNSRIFFTLPIIEPGPPLCQVSVITTQIRRFVVA